MGSLRESFKTNINSANEGVIIALTENRNNDAVVEIGQDGEEKIVKEATYPSFKLSYYSKLNNEFAKVSRKINNDALKKYGVVSFDKLTKEQKDEIALEVFVQAILKEWENFQPEKDGVNLEYSKENAKRIFGDPAWMKLYDYLADKAGDHDNYNQEIVENSAKN